MGLDDDINAVAGVSSENVHHTEYFTLSGKRIAKPSQGICLERIVMSDGTVVNKKVILIIINHDVFSIFLRTFAKRN